jgi:type VI secretion system protein ImpK
MRPEFAIAVDRIFDQAIKLLNRLTDGEACDPSHEHATFLALFDRADIELGAATQWQLAKYALAVWIDEMLLTFPWEGVAWWRNHILEMELFQTRICSLHFYELAKQASAFPTRDALEVFHNCVLLGFRGMYADPEFGHSSAPNSEWPASIEQWLERTSRMIDVKNRLKSSEGQQRSIDGAPPFQDRMEVVWWSAAALILVLVNGVTFHFLYSTS